jgi:hypothetical protein
MIGSILSRRGIDHVDDRVEIQAYGIEVPLDVLVSRSILLTNKI